jgi:DNA-binding transcriptional LysR family regulator
MNDRFESLKLFVRVARTGSFSVAGRELGITQPTASRTLAALEKKVGTALFTRTTRAVTLTEAGADYLARVEAILASLDEADHAARGTGELRGILRIAASTSFAVRTVIPRLQTFKDKHPQLRLELILNDEKQDLIGEGVDVALRIGALTDSLTWTAKKVGIVRRVLAASPAYLDRAGTPTSPAELPQHSIIVGPPGRGMEGWAFTKDGKTTSVRVEGQLLLSGGEGATAAAVAGLGIISAGELGMLQELQSGRLVRVEGQLLLSGGEGATAAAVAGLGIISAGELGMLQELQSGRLVRVLPDWKMGSADINVVLPAGRAAKPSARAFSEFISAEIRKQQTLLDQADPGPAKPGSVATELGTEAAVDLNAERIRRQV